MNPSKNKTQRILRALTPKERIIVRLLLEGCGKREAHRLAYRTNADSHTVLCWLPGLQRGRWFRLALLLAESGDWAALISCAIDADFVT
jgi:hypothetical protein